MGQFEDANLEIGFGVVQYYSFIFRFSGISILKSFGFLQLGVVNRKDKEGGQQRQRQDHQHSGMVPCCYC
jgi:hypothetical protein